jgi:hypothetical protein
MDMMELLTETQQKDLSNAIWIKEVLADSPVKPLSDTIKMTTKGLEIGSDEKVIMIDLSNYGGKFPIPIHKIYGRLLIKGYIGKIEDLNFSAKISAMTNSILYHENPLDSEKHPCVDYLNDVTYINDWKWHVGEVPILGSRVRFMDSEYKKIFDESHEDFDMIWNTMKDQRDLICQNIGIDIKTVDLIVKSRRINNF